MNRRGFLKLLGGAAPAIIHPTYFFAPKGGWPLTGGQHWANNSYGLSTNWSHKTADEVQADVKEMMALFTKDVEKAVYDLMIKTPRIPQTDAGAALILGAVKTVVDDNPYYPKISSLDLSHDHYYKKFLLGEWDESTTRKR